VLEQHFNLRTLCNHHGLVQVQTQDTLFRCLLSLTSDEFLGSFHYVLCFFFPDTCWQSRDTGLELSVYILLLLFIQCFSNADSWCTPSIHVTLPVNQSQFYLILASLPHQTNKIQIRSSTPKGCYRSCRNQNALIVTVLAPSCSTLHLRTALSPRSTVTFCAGVGMKTGRLSIVWRLRRICCLHDSQPVT